MCYKQYLVYATGAKRETRRGSTARSEISGKEEVSPVMDETSLRLKQLTGKEPYSLSPAVAAVAEIAPFFSVLTPEYTQSV